MLCLHAHFFVSSDTFRKGALAITKLVMTKGVTVTLSHTHRHTQFLFRKTPELIKSFLAFADSNLHGISWLAEMMS